MSSKPWITEFHQVGDAQTEWYPGMLIPHGGPLPKDSTTKLPIRPEPSIGCGTIKCPKVWWESKDKYRRLKGVDEGFSLYERFAQDSAAELGFSHVIIRSEMHAVRNTYGKQGHVQMKPTKTGTEPDQPHMSVYLSNQPNWICTHGHIYALEKEVKEKWINNQKNMATSSYKEYAMLPIGRRWSKKIQNKNQYGRNPELWEWLETAPK